MKSMNLFGGNDKSSEAPFGDNKSKATTKPKKKVYSEDFKKKAVKLASKIGVTKTAKELGVSTSSLYSWKKISEEKSPVKSSAPIQDENGNLIFSLEGRTYFLNVNSEKERERVKEEVNANSLGKYFWFKEETGEKHWVLYNVKMYKVYPYTKDFLYYRKDSDLAPVVPINATSCYFMFYNCSSLTQLDLRNFDTSQVTNMIGMFKGCKFLTWLDLSNFDTSNVTDMGGMFYNCKSLIQLDISSFDTSQVTAMHAMFSWCESLAQLDLSNFDTSQVTTMGSMFSYCKALTQLDLSNFDTSRVTNMYDMFYYCELLTQLNLSNFDTSQVTDMYYMFGCCSNLTSLDLSKFNISQVTNMPYMFAACKKLTTIYISDKWNVNSVKYSNDMFEGCYFLPHFSTGKTNIKMAKPIEKGGYLTLKK